MVYRTKFIVDLLNLLAVFQDIDDVLFLFFLVFFFPSTLSHPVKVIPFVL